MLCASCRCVNNSIVSASTVSAKRLGVHRAGIKVTLAIKPDGVRCINARAERVKSSSLRIAGNIYTAVIYSSFSLICISSDMQNWYGGLSGDGNKSYFVLLLTAIIHT